MISIDTKPIENIKQYTQMYNKSNLKSRIEYLTDKSNFPNFDSFLSFVMNNLKNTEGFYEWFSETHKGADFEIAVKHAGGFYVNFSQIKKMYNRLILIC